MMFKCDFYDFTAPLESGGLSPFGEMDIASTKLNLALLDEKAPIIAMQALGEGDDYAGDASTTGVLSPQHKIITVTHSFSDDIDWVRLENISYGNDVIIAWSAGDELIVDYFDATGAYIDGGFFADEEILVPVNATYISFTYLNNYTLFSDFEIILTNVDELNVDPNDDYSGDITTTASLELEASPLVTRGDFQGDNDWVNLQNIPNESSYQVRLDFAPENFVFVEMYDATGVPLSVAAPVLDSVLTFEANTDVAFLGISQLLNGTVSLSASPLDDYAGDTSTTGVIEIGGDPITLRYDPFIGDKDWIGFSANEGDLLTFKVEGVESPDTFYPFGLAIYDSMGAVVSTYPRSYINIVQFEVLETGQYFVGVDYTNNYGTENEFLLTANHIVDDFSADRFTTGALDSSGAEIFISNETILGERDEDWISVNLSANDLVVFDLVGSSVGYNLYDAQGQQIDSLDAGDNIIGFFIEASGTHFLSVLHYARGTFGDYGGVVASYSLLPSEYPADASTFGEIDIDGAPTQSQLEEVGDVDWFAVTAEAGDAVNFEVTDQGFTNVQMRLVDAYGNNVEGFNFGNYGPNLNFTHEFVENGTYYLQVREAWDAWAGSYEITATQLNEDLTAPNNGPNYLGSEYDDSITISAPAELNAGAGDDIVIAGLGNMPSVNFGGGAGVDILLLTVASYQKFDYRAAEFEIATLRDTDGALVGRYSQDGTRDIYTQYDVAGSQPWSRQVTIEDSAAGAAWTSKVFTYSDGGELMSVNINNGQNIVTYDVENANLFWDLRSQTFDVDDNAAWTSSTSFYANIDGFLARTRLTIEYDNGTTSDFEYILFGQNAGNTVQTLTDGGDLHGWDSWVITKNNSGETIESVRSNDNGVVHSLFYNPDAIEGTATRAVNEDTADIFNWTSTERRIDADGNTLSLEIDYDEGFTVFTEYDVAGENPWARIVTQIDVDGTEDWDSRSFFYDDNGVLYDTVYI